MKAMFCVAKQVGDGVTVHTAFRPFYAGTFDVRWTGCPVADYHACNVFAKDQSILDAIAADARTEFVIPIDVDGTKLGYSDEIEVHPLMRGKIIAWCAQEFGADFGQWVATNAKNRRFVAREIMSKVSGILNVDPLNGFRVYWGE